LRLASAGFFQEIRKKVFYGVSHLHRRKLGPWEILNGFLLAEFDAFWISIAQITSEDFPVRAYKGCTEGAG